MIQKDRAMRILKKIRSGVFSLSPQRVKSGKPEVRHIKQEFTTEKQAFLFISNSPRLMMLLNKEKLRALEEEFEKNPEGLELINFVRLMRSAITYSQEDEYDVVHGLCKLFQEIDINGDKHMEWGEFTQYIIDAVMSNKVAAHEIEEVKKKKKQTDILQQTKKNIFSRFGVLKKPVDNNKHLSIIQKAKFSSKFDGMIFLEHLSTKLKIYSRDCKLKQIIDCPSLMSEAFFLDFEVCEASGVIGVVVSDQCIYFYDTSIAVKVFKKIKAPCIQNKIWYMEKHDTWLTAGKDFIVRQWDVWATDKDKLLVAKLLDHKGLIMDMVEITFPQCIATASMDKTIRIYSLLEQIPLGVLKEHKTGVRFLSYSAANGGNILSIGHETYINVWSIEASISRSHIGKLEGHTSPVITAIFFEGTPYVVSIDDKSTVRLWDIRNLTCLQILNPEGTSTLCNGLFIVPNQKKFVSYGKRFNFFGAGMLDNYQTREAINETIPIWAEFNSHYNQIIVITKKEIRLYDAREGKLEKVHAELIDQSVGAEISAFCQDDRHRKFYLGDTLGNITSFNVSNGVMLKNLVKIDPDHHQADVHHSEISRLQFVAEDPDENEPTIGAPISHDFKLLYTSSWDSSTTVYNEEEPEKVQKMRTSTGGHGGHEITVMAISLHLALVVTGAGDGSVSQWDFETGKLEGWFKSHVKEITSLVFLEPLPLLVSGGADGRICIYGVRNAAVHIRNRCLVRFINHSFNGERDSEMGINSLIYIGGKRKGIKKQKREKLQRKTLNEGTVKELMKRKSNGMIDQRTVDLFEEFSITTCSFDPDEESRSSLHSRDSNASPIQDVYKHKTSPAHPQRKHTLLKINSDKSVSFIQDIDVIPDQDNLEQVIDRNYLYITDESGYIKIWDFTKVVTRMGIKPIPDFKEVRPSFNPLRKGYVDGSYIIKSLMKEFAKFPQPQIYDGTKLLQIRELKAHNYLINSFTKIEEPLGFMTTSNDSKVKLWSQELEFWGELNLRQNLSSTSIWEFPFNWEKQQNTYITQVKSIIQEIKQKPVKDTIIFDSAAKSESDHMESMLEEKRQEEMKQRMRELKQIESLKMDPNKMVRNYIGNHPLLQGDTGLSPEKFREVIVGIANGDHHKPSYSGFVKDLEKNLNDKQKELIDKSRFSSSMARLNKNFSQKNTLGLHGQFDPRSRKRQTVIAQNMSLDLKYNNKMRQRSVLAGVSNSSAIGLKLNPSQSQIGITNNGSNQLFDNEKSGNLAAFIKNLPNKHKGIPIHVQEKISHRICEPEPSQPPLPGSSPLQNKEIKQEGTPMSKSRSVPRLPTIPSVKGLGRDEVSKDQFVSQMFNTTQIDKSGVASHKMQVLKKLNKIVSERQQIGDKSGRAGQLQARTEDQFRTLQDRMVEDYERKEYLLKKKQQQLASVGVNGKATKKLIRQIKRRQENLKKGEED